MRQLLRDPEIAADLEAASLCQGVLISAREELTLALARSIHERGAGATRAFVAVTCRPQTTAEEIAEAFRAVEPDGTVFLGRMNDLSRPLHPILRRCISGSRARIIAGAPENLFEVVRAGGFDERLYYQLNRVHVVCSSPSLT